MKKKYERTDGRIFVLRYNVSLLWNEDMQFTQLDLLQMIRHLEPRNQRLAAKVKRLIQIVDRQTNEKTNFNRKTLPRGKYRG